MTMRITRKRLVGALATALVAGGLLPVAVSSPAQAAPVTVSYTCSTSLFGMDYVDGPMNIVVDATLPSSIHDGGETLAVPITIGTTGPKNLPFTVTDAQLVGQVGIELRGPGNTLVSSPAASGGTATAATLAPNAVLPIDWADDLNVSSGGFTNGQQIDVYAGPLQIQYLAANETDVAGTVLNCVVDPFNPKLLGSITVTAAGNDCIANPETCNIEQDLDAEVEANPDGLTLGQLDNVTTFPTTGTQPISQQLNAALDSMQVKDVRGGNVGWSLSAFATGNFVGSTTPDHQIPITALSISPSCASVTTDMSGNPVGAPTAGTTCTSPGGGALPGFGVGNSVGLASSPDVATGAGGTWSVPMASSLDLPAYQPADTYSVLLTVVLTSN